MALATPSPTALNRATRRWSLTRPSLIAETPTSLIYKVERADRSQAALKLLKEGVGADERRGGELLRWYAGYGAAGVFDVADDAVLMQLLVGETLGDLARAGHDASATDILCDVVERLHAPRPGYPPELQRLRERFEALFRTRTSAWPHYALDLLARATGIAYVLFDKWAPQLPLHGDVHHDNILRSGDGWLAIDPKGLVGDGAYDYANSFQNPVGGDAFVLKAPRIARHAAAIAERTGIPRKHLLAWAVAHTALSAAWHIEDGNPITHQVTMLPLLLAAYDAA
ncbi:aminoglycoside phosphotransferase family protein [Devosia sp. ZB163]|uniref:aminoglycoside phosphotransferase family protein n=1 Tax=Devosia sp. ZB163 TaxID=3025938 RepID=UPI00235E5DAC|nr:aminoglycoside phosphotransferase family protein [Devosia sp. ZB163]MDC9824115.1 aminoglycoside phosphotransferase family protein [Devosia sp. ZB163]